jgi:aldose 1-epimerase
MVPWAGRLGLGRFTFDGEVHQVPVDLPPHAIHGLGTHRRWARTGPDSLSLDLGGLWPLGGTATTGFELDADALTMTLELRAGRRSLPAVLGWHPCFRRRLDGDEAGVELRFEPAHCWPRGDDGLPTGGPAPVPPGPWDDCFGGVTEPPVLSWPGGPIVTLNASTDTWVVFDERDHAVCVEPQTAPPDAFNRGDATVLAPGESSRLSVTVSWDRPD